MKKFFLVILLCGVIFLFSSAQVNNISGVDSATTAVSDSATLLSDSSKQLVAGIYDLHAVSKSKKSDLLAPVGGPRLNPRAVSFVQDYMDKNGEELKKMKSWALPYFSMMDAVLTQYDVPKEMKYLAVIESHLKPTLVSWAGAVGPWQFMPETGVRMGLRINRRVDERTDYVKSTHAAGKYLKELYKEFGDWLLVIAAYNGGPGNVNKAIRKSGSRNFWVLQYHLPTESRNHVKKFISTHYVFEGQGGLTTLTKQEVKEQYGTASELMAQRNLSSSELTTARTQVVSGKYHSIILARNILMDVNEFNRYNPSFDRIMSSAENKYELKLPADKMDLFIANKYQILNESIQLMLSSTQQLPASKSNETTTILKVAK
jgi:membrane-bound lytic murein transglycosylase D